METAKTYENYPVWIITLSNLVSLTIYAIGALIIYQAGWIFSVLYLGFILTLELRLIRNHCTSCNYWGKRCGFGKGKISSLFFKKSEINHFCDTKISWKDMLPDLLVSLIPFIVGIVLLIIRFNVLIIFALVLLAVLTTSGNGLIRGKLTCKYCRQKELGCQAYLLFNKNK
jgi:hypothetical protein